MVKEVALLAGVCVCTVPHLAAAQEAATVKAPLAALAGRTAPAIHHAPLAVAREHQDLAVRAVIDRPDLVKRATLVYRHDDRLDEVTFERSDRTDQPYVAVVPGAHVDRPGIAYAIEIERTDGPTLTVFASREDMQPVEVVGDDVDAREESLVSRLGGRRFVLQATGEYVYFGTSPAQVCPGACTASGTQPLVTRSVADQYWRTEAGFTYRLLRTVSEFGIRGGVYRGTSVVPNVSDSSQYSVGLNYGAPWLRLRVEDWLHFEGEFLTSVTEVGFSLGGGASVLLGDPYASHLTVGFEAIDVFGTRAFSRFDVTATRRFRFAPTVEVTSMPHASNAGVRLLMDVTADVGAGWSVTARGGYQARTFDSGGPAAGASLGYAF